MTERYKTLLTIEGPLWCEGCPVVIEKGALLADELQGKNLLQVKFKNVQAKPLKALVIEVRMSDVKGGALRNAQHSYLDLHAGNGRVFGSDVPIWLDDDTARGFEFRVADAVFTDGTSWSAEEAMHTVAPAATLDKFGDLKDQYLREVALPNGKAAPAVMPTEVEALWYCTCGALNAKSNNDCATCGRNHEAQCAATDSEFLADRKARAAEAARLASEQRVAKAKTTTRIAAIGAAIGLVLVLVVLFIANFAVPTMQANAAYNEASSLLASGQYDNAEKSFTALGDFKDSEEMARKTRAQAAYVSGVRLMKEGEPAAAVGAFKECIKNGGFKDAEGKVAEAEAVYSKQKAAAEALTLEKSYKRAVDEMGSSFRGAKIFFENIPSDYKDVAKYQATLKNYAYLTEGFMYFTDFESPVSASIQADICIKGDTLYLKPSVDGDESPFTNWPSSIELQPAGDRSYKFSFKDISGTFDGKTITVRSGNGNYTLRSP